MSESVDGHRLFEGMWVYVFDTDAQRPLAHQIFRISEDGKKITYAGEGGGARVDGVFATSEACRKAHEDSFVHLRIDVQDAYVIFFSLAQQYKRVLQEIEILKKIQNQDLTDVEKAMLPSSLKNYDKAGIREQLDPWISLKMNYEYLLEKVEKEYKRIEGFPVH